MKTAVAETSIAAYYGRVVPKLAASQNERVMAAIAELDRWMPGIDFSLSELVELVGGVIDKSSMSRVVNGLRAANRLQEAPARKCTVTGVTIIPSRLPVKEQGSLF